MLKEWLNPMKVSLFVREYLRAQTYASPASARRVMPIFEWDALDRLLTRNPPDVLIVAQGKLLVLPTPQELGEALDLLTSRVGLVIHRAETDDRTVAFEEQHQPLCMTGSVLRPGWKQDCY
jgi:hypothetical protein